MTSKDDDIVARPEGNNADEWHLFLCQYLDNRAAFPNGLTFMAVHIAEAIDNAIEAQAAKVKELEAALVKQRDAVFELCEDTEDKCAGEAGELEGKMGAYARGRIYEAKSIRKAIAEVSHALMSTLRKREPVRPPVRTAGALK
jgi:hypothetical protein